MPSHRGAHPEDAELFAPDQVPTLRAAVHDLSWLRTRGYGDSSSLKLVGDRYALKRRQRNVVARCACSDGERQSRSAKRMQLSRLSGRWIHVDGFNVLIRLEGLLGGAYIFIARDGAYRDVHPVAGTYRVVNETPAAIRAVCKTLRSRDVEGVCWWLDSHVSNVGRLRERMNQQEPSSLGWEVRISSDVDQNLAQRDRCVATSDSEILDDAGSWCAVEEDVLDRLSGSWNVLDLRPDRTE